MFSDVWLEEHGEDNMKEQRPVKVINKARMRGFRIDYEREIAALAEFSKSQVRNPQSSQLASLANSVLAQARGCSCRVLWLV